MCEIFQSLVKQSAGPLVQMPERRSAPAILACLQPAQLCNRELMVYPPPLSLSITGPLVQNGCVATKLWWKALCLLQMAMGKPGVGVVVPTALLAPPQTCVAVFLTWRKVLTERPQLV